LKVILPVDEGMSMRYLILLTIFAALSGTVLTQQTPSPGRTVPAIDAPPRQISQISR
jgi:hypothetical protein